MILTKEVEFNYDNQIFFKFQDIDLKSNENLLIIGNSGVGKTTLMHLLAGLLKSNSGSIKLFDQELSQLSSHQLDRFRKNNIGIVFQRPHFVNSLTVKENLQLAQYIANNKDNNRIDSILKNLNIFDKSNKKTNQLSQGEKQRASIALAIVNSPKLILADEPTSSLDDANCLKVIELLKKQATDFGAQLIVITHDSRVKKHFKNSIEL
ncbi:ATP-binding cassette domain-containing protein [Flavobacteriaceae bacterium]|nr:ATP-binding cassette domain-containing protein [Flavobacteriaceae bacterium]MDA7716497.1 ATP-binding cassette domain-containing protein [Flavobacteriaceae bacterium]MDA9978008.1 ATP-binding cassette domain-containing protein [Flavobacteriaceae bacterium]MDB4060033.1 ATP-binding cassette domain-containing protein [Flavobacteriaceae bacterium]MDB4131040.1 ATP-binding cassette domain-containing protein [Flavobacteriaceae bacterium]